MAPAWRNDGSSAQFLEGTASDLTGPEGPAYSIVMPDADYEPPECTEQFTDVPCPSLFADWIEDLATRGITRTFGFTLYGS